MTTRLCHTRQWLASIVQSQRADLLPFSDESIGAGVPRGDVRGSRDELDTRLG